VADEADYETREAGALWKVACAWLCSTSEPLSSGAALGEDEVLRTVDNTPLCHVCPHVYAECWPSAYS
jgi:hypothetical protein